MKYELTMISNENQLHLKFICPTFKEAEELAEVMEKDGFTFVKIDIVVNF